MTSRKLVLFFNHCQLSSSNKTSNFSKFPWVYPRIVPWTGTWLRVGERHMFGWIEKPPRTREHTRTHDHTNTQQMSKVLIYSAAFSASVGLASPSAEMSAYPTYTGRIAVQGLLLKLPFPSPIHSSLLTPNVFAFPHQERLVSP